MRHDSPSGTPLPLMEMIRHEPLKRAPRLRPSCEPSRTASASRATSSSSQRHTQIALFDHHHVCDVDEVVEIDTDNVVMHHPAVGMSENLSILPGGYFAQLLAVRSN